MDKKLNITMLCEFYGNKNNGTTIATMNLVEQLRNSGHNVTVIACDKNSAEEEGYVLLPVMDLGCIFNTMLKNNNVIYSKYVDAPIRQAISSADVVYLNVPTFMTMKAIKVAVKLNKPIVAGFHCQAENVTSHFGLLRFKWVNKIIYGIFYNKIYRYCSAIHFPTQFIQDVFEKSIQKSVPGVVISNGVSNEFFKDYSYQKNDKFTILCSGRYSKEKAQIDLLKAVASSQYKGDIKIILAGDGPRKKPLMRFAQKHKLDCEFQFFSRAQLIEQLHRSHLYVHTSIAEIEAIACMEAIVCGLVPVICNSPQSATKYFAVDDTCLYEPHNFKQLKDKIEYFYQNPQALANYQVEYDKRKNAFHLEDCMNKMEQAFLQVSQKNKE